MISNNYISQAIANIAARNERQDSIEKVSGSFVDYGLTTFLINKNHQIITGRRGTGKTHVLRALSEILKEKGIHSIYLDCRTFGSTSSFSDNNNTLKKRCVCLFSDILNRIHDNILQYVFDNSDNIASNIANNSLYLLDELVGISSRQDKIAEDISIKEKDTNIVGKSLGGSFGFDNGLKAGVNANKTDSKQHENEVAYKVRENESIAFPDINSRLNKLLNDLKLNIFILIDEWSSLPIDLQPYLGEFIRRGIFVCDRVTVKIATIQYRSQFLIQSHGDKIGLELGGDISDDVDLDGFYDYDANPQNITSFFAEMLFRHFHAELEDILINQLGISDAKSLIATLFTQSEVFEELVRASEGVPRDFIKILTRAFMNSKKRTKEKIDKQAIMDAAREWYTNDKLQPLSEKNHLMLEAIVNDVIGGKQSRSFLVEQKHSHHAMLQELFDYRVIHIMKKGYASKDSPGTRYDVFRLDYGAYVELMKTKRQISFFEKVGSADTVPYDDKRSIRRVILDSELLESFAV